MSRAGAAQSGRQAHIREQISQLLYTQPGERVFLPQFGIGLAQLLFLPMTDALWRRIEVTLGAQLADALAGEVLADTIQVSAGPSEGDAATLRIVIRYQLAALNLSEEVQFEVTDGVLALPHWEASDG
jgi:hypothetical protein